jgi:phage shock protein C
MFAGKRTGYGMDLYRSRSDRWLAGVCGGIAENMQVQSWLVRLGFFTLFLFTGSFAVMLYLLAVILIAKRPGAGRSRCDKGRADCGPSRREAPQANLKETLFSYGPSPSGRVAEISKRMQSIDEKLRRMETYVTSRKFQFDREIRRS